MRILVLGSAGQIGAALVTHLRENNHEVIEFDIYTEPEEDLRIQGILDDLLPEMDFVYFLAFDVGGSTYLQKYQNTYEFIDNNIKLMTHTFDSLKKAGTPFIFASSQMSNMSYSPYGVLKRLGECYTNTLNGHNVHFWNVYGPEHNPEKTHVITDFVSMALNNGEIDMRTDGKEERQFLYVEDCCEALQTIMERRDEIPKDKPLHITNFEWSSVMEVAEIIADLRSDDSIVKINPSTKTDSVQLDKRNEPDPYILEFWKSKTSLRKGIQEIISNF